MTTTEHWMAVGIFEDQAKAEQAIHELHQAGFHDDQISYAGHGASSSGILASLKRLFTGQDTTSGTITDDLVERGMMPEADARYYQQEYEAGRSIVAVMTDGRSLQEATTILTRNGAYGAKRPSVQTTDDRSTASSGAQNTAANTEEERRLQLHEEQLQVHKRPVQTGEVRLSKEVVTEQKTINVPVTREEMVIEHRPVSGQVSETPIGEGETIRIPISEEQVTVSKQTIETGEVALGKRQVQETQQVSDTVRREEARFEHEGNVNVQGSDLDKSTQQPEQAQVWTFEHPLQQADSHRPILLQVHAPGIVHAGINREGKWIRTYDVPLEEVAPGVWEAYLLDSEINELTFIWYDPDQPGKVLWEGKNYPLPR